MRRKGKFDPLHQMKAHRRSTAIAPVTLSPGRGGGNTVPTKYEAGLAPELICTFRDHPVLEV